MNKNCIIDYFSYILIRLIGPIIRSLPKGVSVFLGERLGDLFYYFDFKHKTITYANIKSVFADKLSPIELSNLAREFYRTFGQNLIDIFMIPSVNKDYMNKYISFEGLDNIERGFKRGKGVILLGSHEGSWELSNIICANLGFPFALFVRDQEFPLLNQLLHLYRSQQGCRIIQRQNQTRQLIDSLKRNESIGMTVDQGGKNGTLVKFLGREASMATGAIRLALKYDTTIIPAFYTRIKGPYIKIIIDPPFEIKKTQDLEKDVRNNLQELVRIFEKHILEYPKEYLWTYKVWKYGREKNILILTDTKAGHLRQAEAVANIMNEYLKEKGFDAKIETIEVKFKSKPSKYILTFTSCLAGKYNCQGCLWCLKRFLREDIYESLTRIKPDLVISCGSALAPVNYVLSRENLAKSIVIMRPSILNTKRFDLVIMPRHDNPPKRKNVLVTEGALNLIDEQYLKEQSEKLIQALRLKGQEIGNRIGLLIGGDSKDFYLKQETILEVIRQTKSAAERLDADILLTTSRRTSIEIQNLIKEEFKDYPRCKLLVIANEKNIPEAVGGILGLSRVIICSPESISMISEAIKSAKYVLVFESEGLGKKHKRFLEYSSRNKYIYLSQPSDLSKKIEDIWQNKPPIHTLKDNLLIRGAISKIL